MDDVWVILTDANGCSVSVMIPVVTNPAPTAIAGAMGMCEDESIQLSETGTGGITWSWTTDGGATFDDANTQNPVATGAVDGETFTVVVTNDNGCSATDQITVMLSSPVVVVDPVLELCVSDTMCVNLGQLSGTVSTTGTVDWYNGDPATGGIQIFPTSCVSINKIDDGLWVQVTDDKGCSGEVEVTIILNDNPTAIAAATGMCENEDITLTDNGTGGLMWSWTTNGNATIADPAAQTTTASGALDGDSFTVIATNEAGCSDTSTVVVMVSPPIVLPTPILEFCPSDTMCVNLGGLGGVVSTDGTVDWYDGDPDGSGIQVFPVSCVSLDKVDDLWATVTDDKGCSYAVDVTVIVESIQIIACPADITVTPETGCEAMVTVPALVFDACEGATVTNDYNGTADASDVYPFGTTTVVWTVSDGGGNAVTCDMTVTVTSPSGGTVTTTTVDTICMISDQDLFIDDIGFGPNGDYTFTDPGTSTSAVITDITLEIFLRLEGGSCESDVEAMIYDPTGALVASFPAGSLFSTCNGGNTLYNTTVSIPSATVTGAADDWIAEFNDANGQNAGDEYSLRFGRICYIATTTTVTTVSPLMITSCPADVTVAAPAATCEAMVMVDPLEYDACIPGIVVNDYTGTDDASGVYPVGTTVVTWTVTDLAGNVATCETTVTVTGDDEPTIVLCQSTVSATADPTSCDATLTIPQVSAVDCGTITITNDYTNTNDASGTYPIGTTVVTWTVTDNDGNTATCSTTVTVTDDGPTIVSCPANVMQSVDAASCDATVTISAPGAMGGLTAEDCGTITITNDYNGTADASDTYPIGTTVVIWTVTDNDGNTATCSMDVTVVDDGPTIVSCPFNMVQGVDAPGCDAAITVPVLIAEDCGTVTVINDYTNTADASGTYPIGTTVVTWTVTDNDGNSVTCSTNITVVDDGPTIVNCPAAVSAMADPQSCDAVVAVEMLSAEDCGTVTITNDYTNTDNASGTYPIGTTVVTWTVTDNDGNSVTCSTDVTVTDGGPMIVCPADITENVNTANCDAVVSVPAPMADDCGTVTVTNDFNNTADASGTYPIGTTEVVWTVTDNDGNTATCSMNVTVVDGGPVIASCPANMTQGVDAPDCSAAVTVPALVANDCGTVTVVNDFNGTSDASGTYPIGTTVVIWTVTDADGNSATCSTDITVIDDGPTIVDCPAATTGSVIPGQCVGMVSIPALVAEDCGTVTITNDFNGTADASGMYPVGTTTVVWTVTDNDGNTATCSTDVTISDDGPTLVFCQGTASAQVDPATCDAIVSVPAPIADDCGTVTITNDFNGTADASDTYSVGTTTVVWTITDNDGNTVTCSTDVTVTDVGPTIVSCPAAITQGVDAPDCSAAVTVPALVANDCGTVTVVNDFNGTSDASDVYPVGTTTVVWTVTDNDGNTATCSTDITIVDDGPSITDCPVAATGVVTPNTCNGQVTVPALVAEDCGIVTITNDQNGTADASGTYPVGTTTVVWTVTDNDGNTATCSTDVTVSDDGPAIIGCQPTATAEVDPGTCEAMVSISPLLVDDCGTVVITNDYNNTANASDIYPLGITTVAWTVTDNDGNVATCSTEVTVTEGTSVITVMDTISIISDVDGFIDDVGFANNLSTSYQDPGTDANAVLSDIELLLYFRLVSGSCEGDIDIRVTDPAGNSMVFPAIFGAGACQGGNALFITTVDIPSGSVTGSPANWIVEFDDSDGQNTGDEYSIRAGILTYVATTTMVVGGAPTITDCPADVMAMADPGTCEAAVSVDPLQATDCGTFTVTNDYNNTADASDTYPVGTTTVTWTVTDNDGNTATCSTDVTVTDGAGPTIVSCPADITVEAPDNGTCEADIDVSLLTATDCGTFTVANDFTGTDDATGTYPVGTTLVTWTVTDNDGNETTCQQLITVTAPITSADVEMVSDQDDFVDVGGFAANPVMTFTDPGTVVGASLTDIELTLFFKTVGAACESDIAIQVTDPVGNIVAVFPAGSLFQTCIANPNTLHQVTVSIPGAATTGQVDFWTVQFDAGLDSNVGDFEYTFRAGVLNYTASFNTCGGPVFFESDNIEGVAATIEEAPTNDIKLFPVPTMTRLNLEYTAEMTENLRIEIFNADGRVMIARDDNALEGLNRYELDVTTLAAGTYFLRTISADGETKVKPFIKVSP